MSKSTDVFFRMDRPAMTTKRRRRGEKCKAEDGLELSWSDDDSVIFLSFLFSGRAELEYKAEKQHQHIFSRIHRYIKSFFFALLCALLFAALLRMCLISTFFSFHSSLAHSLRDVLIPCYNFELFFLFSSFGDLPLMLDYT